MFFTYLSREFFYIIFVISRNIEILIELNYWLEMYMQNILKE